MTHLMKERVVLVAVVLILWSTFIMIGVKGQLLGFWLSENPGVQFGILSILMLGVIMVVTILLHEAVLNCQKWWDLKGWYLFHPVEIPPIRSDEYMKGLAEGYGNMYEALCHGDVSGACRLAEESFPEEMKKIAEIAGNSEAEAEEEEDYGDLQTHRLPHRTR